MSAPSRSPFNLNDPSAYAPRQTRERLAAERISRESDPLRAPHAQNLVLGGDETELRPPHAPKRSEHQNELIDEHDLDRLLTSLRWLPQRLADKRRADEPQSPSALTRCATAVCHPATKEVDFQSLPIPEPQRMGLPPPGARQSHRILAAAYTDRDRDHRTDAVLFFSKKWDAGIGGCASTAASGAQGEI